MCTLGPTDKLLKHNMYNLQTKDVREPMICYIQNVTNTVILMHIYIR